MSKVGPGLLLLGRVLLFMGFGGLFLVLSYFFKDLLSGERDPESGNVETGNR